MKKLNKKKCLIIETHSDDSCISAYGFLNKFRAEYDYYFALMTASDIKLIAINKTVNRKQRIQEYLDYVNHFNGVFLCRENCQVDISPFDADTRLNQIARGEVVYMIETALDYVKPDLMLVTGKSSHTDHVVTYEAAMSALRPCSVWKPKQVLIMENAINIKTDPTQNSLVPNYYCILSEDEIAKKIDIFYNIFVSQRKPTAIALSTEGIKSFAKYRALEVGADYAEAFYQLYKIV